MQMGYLVSKFQAALDRTKPRGARRRETRKRIKSVGISSISVALLRSFYYSASVICDPRGHSTASASLEKSIIAFGRLRSDLHSTRNSNPGGEGCLARHRGKRPRRSLG